MPGPDPAAVRSLMRTFWSAAGWKDDPTTPTGELQHAVACGVMFADERVIGHDKLMADIHALASNIRSEEAGDAFLASLSTRRLDLRSALGSVAVARHLPDHSFVAGRDGPWCAVCGALESERVDRNVLNFERLKWGGVRRLDLTYVWHDLDLFANAGVSTAGTAEDRSLMAALLNALRAAHPDMTAARASKDLLRMLPSNAEERRVILDILGVSSVLETEEHRGFTIRFTRFDERRLPAHRFVDQAYPVCWWTGADGVNDHALREFGLL